MLRAASDLLDEIREKGTQAAFLDRMLTRQELYELIGYDAYHRIEARYLPRE
jgi:methylisocitrate lyase